MNNQMSIDFAARVHVARSLGAEAGARAADRAERADPAFRTRALDFIVGYIRQQGEATGESATAAAVLPRAKGHGSMGGKLYAPGHVG